MRVTACALCVVLVAGRAVAQEPVEINREALKELLSPPRIVGASSCPSDGRLYVSLTGGNAGNNYEVLEFDPANPQVPLQSLGVFPVNPAANTDLTFAEIALNGPAPLIGALQRTSQGTASSLSAQFQVEDPAKRSSRGHLPFPIFACGRATYSAGHQPGDFLYLYGTDPNAGSYLRFKLKPAQGTNDYLQIGSTPFRFTESVTLTTAFCGGNFNDTSVTWHYASGQRLPKPRFDTGLVLPGAPTFSLGGIITGAQLSVSVTRQGNRTDWTEACADSPCVAFVPAPLGGLLPGDQVEVSQELCDGTVSDVATTQVADCSAMPIPDVVNWPRHGDTSTQVRVSPPGVVNVVLVGDGFGSRDNLQLLGTSMNTDFVGFTRPLTSTDTWLVLAQPTDACPTPLGADFSIVP